MKKQELLYKILDELKPPRFTRDKIYDVGDWSDSDTTLEMITVPLTRITIDDILNIKELK